MRDLILAQNVKSPEGPLKDYCFVLDPGHGGSDPGTHQIVGSQTAFESSIVYDVAMRFMTELGKQGAIVYLTHSSSTIGARDVDYPTRIPTVFDDGKDVTGTSQIRSLHARKAFAGAVVENQQLSKGRKVIFVSLHADYDPHGQRKNFGVYIDAPRGKHATAEDQAFAEKLKTAFGGAAFVKEQGLYALRNNSASQRVLIELGNVRNHDEVVALLADKVGRQKLANRLIHGFSQTLGNK